MKVKAFTNGVFKDNAVFRQFLGLCPTLAVTSAAINGLALGLATTAVLLGSNMIISLLAKYIPKSVRIPSYILVIASLVTVVDLLMNAYVHDLHKVLGLFIPLIVVNCIVLGRAEIFASKNNVLDSMLDALGSGLGFTLALLLLASVRELFGEGSIFGVRIMPEAYNPFVLFVMPAGAFITLGLLIGMVNMILNLAKKARS